MSTVRHRLMMILGAIGMVAVALGNGATPADAVNAPLEHVVSAQPTPKTPYVLDGTVYAIAPVGNRVVVGGNFTTVKDYGNKPKQNIVNLFLYDKNTGRIDQAWKPAVDGQVNALVGSADGRSVYVGGQFRSVNGTARQGVVKLDLATGTLDPTFNAGMNGWVLTLTAHGDRVYAGGYFTKVRNVARERLAGLDAATGKADGLNLAVTDPARATQNVKYMDVSADGRRLVIVGNFTKVAGAPRSLIAVIDLTTSTLADWNTSRFGAADCSTSFDTYMRDVDISPDGRWFSVVTTGAYRPIPKMCDTASRWELDVNGSDLAPTWTNYTGGDTLTGVAVTPAAVYVGGHQRWMNNSNIESESKGPGAVDRPGLAALDPSNGVPLKWNPGRDRGVGVFAMVATGDGLYIGHDTNVVAGGWHPRLTFFPLAGGTPNPQLASAELPGDLYMAGTDGKLTGRSFDGATFGNPRTLGAGVDWSRTRGAFLLDGKLYTAQSDGALLVRNFDGATGNVGPATNLASWVSFADATGMFFEGGKLYFTRSGDPKLYYRYFAPESGIVGSQLFVASGDGDGLDWSRARSLTMASGRLYYADDRDRLYRIDWNDGAPVAGTATTISGPGVDDRRWSSRALVVGPLTGR